MLPQLKKKPLADEIGMDRQDMGPADTLRYNIMVFVVEENYDRAIEELRNFMEADSEFPKFKDKVFRYVEHAVDLINAIRAKRNFPGASSLTMAKQQELKERFHEHFNELQRVLRSIDKVQAELRIDDIRSTVWVVRALVNSLFAIVIIAFLLEASRGLAANLWIVLDDVFLTLTDWVFKTIGL